MARRPRASNVERIPSPKPDAPASKLPLLVCLATIAAIGALYVRTAARDIVLGDSPELTGTAIVLGVAHPPGYPVWTILAHLFSLLPVGSLPFRISLFSVVAALVCLAIVYATAYRMSRSVIGSATAATALGLVPAVWAWSVVPEVFSLANALAAGLVFLLLAWHLDRHPASFVAAAFIGGLGMAHHQTIALLAPAVLYLMWQHRRAFRGGGLFARAALAFGAGLLPYLMLPIAAARQTSWNWGDVISPADLAAHVLRIGYGTGALVSEAKFQGGATAERVLSFGRSFTVGEAILLAIGLAALYRRDRVWFWFIAIAGAISGPAFIAYTNINLSVAVLQAVLERFFLLAHVVLAPIAALGVVAAAEALRKGLRAPRSMARLAAAFPAIGIAVGVALVQLPRVDQSENHAARTFAEDILASVRPNAILLVSGDAVISPIAYLRTIEGVRPDITFVQMPLLRGDWYVRQLKRDYPGLVIRYQRFDGAPGTLRALVEQNDVQRFDIMGTLIDDSLGGTYGLYRRGLVEELRPRLFEVDLTAFAAQNDAALKSYRISDPASVAERPWERLILGDYGLVAYDVAGVFARSKRYAEARDWYARAIAIDPDLVEARAALKGLPQ